MTLLTCVFVRWMLGTTLALLSWLSVLVLNSGGLGVLFTLLVLLAVIVFLLCLIIIAILSLFIHLTDHVNNCIDLVLLSI
jgi:hypothetical protein